MEDNGLNQNFILCLGSKYLLPDFCSKAIYIHIIFNMEGNPIVVLPHGRETYEGRLFYAILWIEILEHMVHYPCAIYALIDIAKVSAGYCFCNNSLSSSSAIST